MNILRRIVARFKESKAKPYAAIFLDRPSQLELLRWWKDQVNLPLLGNIKAHHMTIKFDPEPGFSAPVGAKATLKIVGWQADSKGQAVAVLPHGIKSYNQHPHVTVAVAPGVSAVYSNQLLAGGVVAQSGPTLSGIVDIRTD